MRQGIHLSVRSGEVHHLFPKVVSIFYWWQMVRRRTNKKQGDIKGSSVRWKPEGRWLLSFEMELMPLWLSADDLCLNINVNPKSSWLLRFIGINEVKASFGSRLHLPNLPGNGTGKSRFKTVSSHGSKDKSHVRLIRRDASPPCLLFDQEMQNVPYMGECEQSSYSRRIRPDKNPI